MTIGDRIKKRRIELGLSAESLGERIGKDRATIYRYENKDIKNMPLSILTPLAKALQVSPSWLLGEPETDDEYIAALGEIKPLGELPPEAEAINIFAESFGERIIKVDNNLFFGECGMLSEDELNYIKSSASDAVKFSYEQIKKKRLSSLF